MWNRTGEAYLHDGWTEVVRAIRSHDLECTMVTGGRGGAHSWQLQLTVGRRRRAGAANEAKVNL
jgi:hypothetical protein